ncbi:MAG: lamin tail domain-containing protein [Verrucomicrobiales bacterium]
MRVTTRCPVLILLLMTLWLGGREARAIDSVVTFNEVHYHPAAGEAAGEWIELKNQNSVDVDLSGWRLDGGVDYVFPEGTVIGSGRYLVVAADPAAVMAATGLATVAGPWANTLNNAGESVTLKNNNGRRMDEIDFGDTAPWPVAADGSGATLAKRNEMRDSGLPENWRASLEVGGTPGRYNFTVPSYDGTIPPDGVLRTVDRWYPFDGTADDSSGNGRHGALLNGPVYSADVAPLIAQGQSLDLNGTNSHVNIPDPVNPVAYTVAAWVRPDVIRAQSIVVRTNASGPTVLRTHQIRMSAQGVFEHYTVAGTARTVTGTTVAVAGQWYHVAIVAAIDGLMRLFVNGTEEGTPLALTTLAANGTRWMIGSNSGGGMTYFDGLVDDVGIWHGAMDASQVGHLVTRFTLPNQMPRKNLALGKPVIAGSGAYPNLAFNEGVPPNDFSAANVADGSASDVFGSSYWLGRDGVAQESFVLDLKAPVEISQILLRNTHNHQFNDRGTAEFRLLAATAVDASHQPVDPVPLYTGSLTNRSPIAPLHADSPIPGDLISPGNGLAMATARYIKFESLTSWYGQNVGLNEIEVFGPPAGSTNERPPDLPLVINEITPAEDETPWIELLNHGTEPLTLTGFVLESSQGASHTLPSMVLAGGGFLVLEGSATGLRPADGEKLFLYSADRDSVVDAVLVESGRHQLRRPPIADGGPGEFLTAETPDDITKAAANRIAVTAPIVINEIMYHRRPQYLPYVENEEEWVELYNTSGSPVDLGGWRITDGIEFVFPVGTMIPSGGYLCISNEAAAFSAAHPEVPVIGDFSGRLSNRGERLILRNAFGNPVDTVFYRDKEPWPIYTDGLGSSLELRHPEADNSVPESWANSDESTRSEWKNYTVTATARTPIYSPTITNTGTTAFHELRLGLLEEGEVLVDDVSVREVTTAPTVELIQNGAFDTPLKPVWRVLGNHGASSVVDDVGNPVLRVHTTGPLLYMHNLLETTFKSGITIVPVVNNRQYTISLRAKWLRGCPWLHTEIYYNKVTKTFLLEQPARSGTPGARNSVFEPNLGPTFSHTRHHPVVPAPSTPIAVTTRVSDPQGLGTVAVRYSVNGAATFLSVPMTTTPDGRHTATIPGQNANAIIQFYLEAEDAAPVPAAATWPAAGPASRALIRVNDNRAVPTKQNLRVITTAADATALANSVDMMSNQRRGCTIVHNERDIYYNGKVRLRGSMFSRSSFATAGESITFPADNLFRGSQRTVSVRRSGINEIVVKHAINHAGGLPDNYNDVIHLIGFRSDIVGSARMEMERFSNSWLDEFYPEGSDGTLFKLEGIRVPTQTFANGTIRAGNAEGIKNLTTSGIGWVVQLDLADLGPDGGQYRHAYRWLNNFSRNDNARFVQMCRTLSMPVGTAAQQLAFEQAIEPLMDVDEWMRCLAMMSLFCIDDAYARPGGPTSNPHNLNFYMPPTPDGKITAIPWDWNFVFAVPNTAPLTGDKNIQKVINRPRFKRLFLGHLKHIIDTTFNAAYMTRWLTHYGTTAGETYTNFISNINGRRSHVLSQINVQIPPVAFSVTTNGGADFTVDGPSAVLEGDGWVEVRDIRLNGSPESLPVTWIDANSWRLTVPLAPGAQTLTLTAHDGRGVPVGSDAITLTNTSPIQPASEANIVISKVHYHPAGPEESEFIELMNISPTHPVDLTGCAFTSGIDYAFADGTLLAPGARLVLTASQFLNDTALNNAGERLRLEAPGGVIIKDFTYNDAPPWPTMPDGLGPALVLIAPWTNPDHDNPFHWRASLAAGGAPGESDTAPLTDDLLVYALGPNPAISFLMTPQGPAFSVPRVPNADHAEIIGEISASLQLWSPALPIEASATSLVFAVPEDMKSNPQIFTRVRVRAR